MSFSNNTPTNNQNSILPPTITKGRKTLDQVQSQKPFEIPERYSGDQYVTEQTIFALNYTNQAQQVFLYKGKIEEGQIEGVVPYKHFFCPPLGGCDAVPILNKWIVQMQLFVDSVDNHESSDTSFNPSDFILDSGYGTYDVKWDNNNLISITRGNDVVNPNQETFYFRFLTSDVNWRWDLKLFCDRQLVGSLCSQDVTSRPMSVKSRSGVRNQDKVPTHIGLIKVENSFTIVTVMCDNVPKDMNTLLLKRDNTLYFRYSQLSDIVAGQTYLFTVEDEDENTAVADVMWTKKIMRSTPLSTRSPPNNNSN